MDDNIFHKILINVGVNQLSSYHVKRCKEDVDEHAAQNNYKKCDDWLPVQSYVALFLPQGCDALGLT